MTTYEDWTAENWGGNEYGHCEDATAEMVRAFPTLRRVAGFYHCPAWGRRQHWWCVDPDGKIVDPTAAQFPSLGGGRYEELDLTSAADLARIPTGKCMDCGDPVYGGSEFCSLTCSASTMRYLGFAKDGEARVNQR